MPNAVGQMADIYQTQLAASRRVADVMLSGTGEIDRLVINAARRAVATQLNQLQTTVGGAMEEAIPVEQAPEESNIAVSTEIVRILTEMQTEIGKTLQACMQQLSDEIAHHARMQSIANAPPVIPFNPMSGIFSAWRDMAGGLESRNQKDVADRPMNGDVAASATDIPDDSYDQDEDVEDAPSDNNPRNPVMHSVRGQGEKRPGTQRRK